ncbi:hypothetical protein ACWDSJ_30415 [Nocardia sp. NPDC003482]
MLLDHSISVEQAHRIMRQHRACRAVWCPMKAAAFGCLVRAGRIVPPSLSPRERAAARGIVFPALDDDFSAPMSPYFRTLLRVLERLADVEGTHIVSSFIDAGN